MKIIFDNTHYEIQINYPGQGITYARLMQTNTEHFIVVGCAVCSLKDRFSKDKGRKLAIARMFKSWSAVHLISPNVVQRRAFWWHYLHVSSFRSGKYELDLDVSIVDFDE